MAGETRPFRSRPAAPADKPELPRLPPLFGSGWYAVEGVAPEMWHWSDGHGQIEFYRPEPSTPASTLSFELYAPDEQTVRISHNGKLIYGCTLGPSRKREQVILPIDWSEGPPVYTVQFASDQPPFVPLSDDKRWLAFQLFNLPQSPPVFSD
ncbi:MAG: hypothetical protein M3Y69_09440 [Verrucomicrobiota bacterium]|nr:hypothetical protein [Verrucomicrobiota bacterium]